MVGARPPPHTPVAHLDAPPHAFSKLTARLLGSHRTPFQRPPPLFGADTAYLERRGGVFGGPTGGGLQAPLSVSESPSPWAPCCFKGLCSSASFARLRPPFAMGGGIWHGGGGRLARARLFRTPTPFRSGTAAARSLWIKPSGGLALHAVLPSAAETVWERLSRETVWPVWREALERRVAERLC